MREEIREVDDHYDAASIYYAETASRTVSAYTKMACSACARAGGCMRIIAL